MATAKKKAIAVKTAPLTVDGENYVVRTNLPMQVIADLNNGEDYDRLIRALERIVIEHPFEEGPGGWDTDVVTAFMKAFGALMEALPPA